MKHIAAKALFELHGCVPGIACHTQGIEKAVQAMMTWSPSDTIPDVLKNVSFQDKKAGGKVTSTLSVTQLEKSTKISKFTGVGDSSIEARDNAALACLKTKIYSSKYSKNLPILSEENCAVLGSDYQKWDESRGTLQAVLDKAEKQFSKVADISERLVKFSQELKRRDKFSGKTEVWHLSYEVTIEFGKLKTKITRTQLKQAKEVCIHNMILMIENFYGPIDN